MLIDKLKLRAANDKDLNFILKSWLKNYRKSNFGSELDEEDYFETYQNAVKECLKQSKVAILCDEQDPFFIYAFFVVEEHAEANVLHYLYVRDDFRNTGIARQIHKQFLKDKTLFYTHKTKMVTKEGRYIPVAHELAQQAGAIYRPFLFFKKYL